MGLRTRSSARFTVRRPTGVCARSGKSSRAHRPRASSCSKPSGLLPCGSAQVSPSISFARRRELDRAQHFPGGEGIGATERLRERFIEPLRHRRAQGERGARRGDRAGGGFGREGPRPEPEDRPRLVRTGAAARLTVLFYEARFSTHPMPLAQRDEAQRALAELAGSLRDLEPADAGGTKDGGGG